MPKSIQPKASLRQTITTKPEVTQRPVAIPNFDELPDSALVRQAQLVRDPRHPTRPTPLPFSPATFWRKVKKGTFPTPQKLSEGVTAWRVGSVREWMAAQEAQVYDTSAVTAKLSKRIALVQA